MGGHGGDDQHPGQRHHQRHQRGERGVPQAPGENRRRRRQHVRQKQHRQHEPGLEHLRLEGQSHPGAGHDQVGQASRREGGRRGVGREHQQEDQQRVRDVAPVEQDRDGRGGQHDGGGEPGTCSRHAPDGTVEHEHGESALDGLGQHDGPDVKAEQPDRQRLHPERTGQLVNGDGAPRIERAEEEVVPALGHAAHRGAVERLERRVVHAPRVGQRGQRGHSQQKGSGPPGLVRRRAPELPAHPTHGGRARRRGVAGRDRCLEHELPDSIPHTQGNLPRHRTRPGAIWLRCRICPCAGCTGAQRRLERGAERGDG